MKKITFLITFLIASIGYSQELPFNFDESDNPAFYFTCFDCNFELTTDPDDASNPVGQLTGFPNQNFDTAQTLNLEKNIDLSDNDNNTITFRFRPVNGTGSGNHLMKFEGGSPIVEMAFTSTGTDWQNISIDFGEGLGNYSNLIIFPDFDNASSDTYLIDDLAGGTNVEPSMDPIPDAPAPTPTTPDSEVFNLYGETGNYTMGMAYDYTFGTLAGTPDLDDSSVVNEALKYDFSVAGWGAGQNASSDLTGFQFVNFYYWASSEATDFKLFIISQTAGATTETTYEVGTASEPIVAETWTFVSVPVSEFISQGFDITNFLQYKFDVTSIKPGIVYIDNLYFSQNVVLGVDDLSLSDFQLYPNPSNTEWNLKSLTTQIRSISVVDVLGKEVMNLKVDANEAKIPSSKLSTGLYLAKVSTDNGSAVLRLIKN